jgi:(2S)-methylsuccinyl-CoA dehydrogenase
VSRELPEAIERLRAEVAGRIGDGGLDAHQVAASHLAWAVARAEAAEACAEWAAATGDPLAGRVAEVAEVEALAFAQDRSCELRALGAERLAAIHDAYRPIEDVGASDEHRLLRATLREFADREVRPHAQSVHRRDLDVPEEVIRGVAALGLFGLSVPEAYGGVQGAAPDFRAMLVATEELSRASLAVGGSLITRPEILVRALLRGGTEAQRREWLPAIASGEKLVAVAVTEPDHGSDVASVACRAVRRPDGDWVITGTKLWCTFAGRSELLMILCRTSDAGHRGLSVFVVEKPAFPGHEFEHRQPSGGSLAGRAIPTIGYRGMHTFELAFDRYRVPASGLVGGEEWRDRGFYLQMEGFAVGRVQTAARAVGVMQAALEDALGYARSRSVFGRAVADLQLPAATLGAMIARVAAARQLGYRAARLLDAGGGQMESSLAKLHASRAAESVTRDAVQLHGAMGYGEETDVSRYFVDARVLSIFEGAEEVLALRVIARSLLARSPSASPSPPEGEGRGGGDE